MVSEGSEGRKVSVCRNNIHLKNWKFLLKNFCWSQGLHPQPLYPVLRWGKDSSLYAKKIKTNVDRQRKDTVKWHKTFDSEHFCSLFLYYSILLSLSQVCKNLCLYNKLTLGWDKKVVFRHYPPCTVSTDLTTEKDWGASSGLSRTQTGSPMYVHPPE